MRLSGLLYTRVWRERERESYLPANHQNIAVRLETSALPLPLGYCLTLLIPLLSPRSLLCLGRLGEYGRLGHGNRLKSSRALLVKALLGSKIVQVAAGGAHSVAISWEGRLCTWGWGLHGKLGHGDGLDRLVPTWVDLSMAARQSGDVRGFCAGMTVNDVGQPTICLHAEPSRRRTFCPTCKNQSPTSGEQEHREAPTPEAGDNNHLVPFVTCASASSFSTYIGMRDGTVLVAGEKAHGDEFRELWRLPQKSRSCRFINSHDHIHAKIHAHDIGELLATVIDSEGAVYALHSWSRTIPSFRMVKEIRVHVCNDDDDCSSPCPKRCSGGDNCQALGSRGNFKCSSVSLSLKVGAESLHHVIPSVLKVSSTSFTKTPPLRPEKDWAPTSVGNLPRGIL